MCVRVCVCVHVCVGVLQLSLTRQSRRRCMCVSVCACALVLSGVVVCVRAQRRHRLPIMDVVAGSAVSSLSFLRRVSSLTAVLVSLPSDPAEAAVEAEGGQDEADPHQAAYVAHRQGASRVCVCGGITWEVPHGETSCLGCVSGRRYVGVRHGGNARMRKRWEEFPGGGGGGTTNLKRIPPAL